MWGKFPIYPKIVTILLVHLFGGPFLALKNSGFFNQKLQNPWKFYFFKKLSAIASTELCKLVFSECFVFTEEPSWLLQEKPSQAMCRISKSILCIVCLCTSLGNMALFNHHQRIFITIYIYITRRRGAEGPLDLGFVIFTFLFSSTDISDSGNFIQLQTWAGPCTWSALIWVSTIDWSCKKSPIWLSGRGGEGVGGGGA